MGRTPSSSASSTISTARSTPKQNPNSSANKTSIFYLTQSGSIAVCVKHASESCVTTPAQTRLQIYADYIFAAILHELCRRQLRARRPTRCLYQLKTESCSGTTYSVRRGYAPSPSGVPHTRHQR